MKTTAQLTPNPTPQTGGIEVKLNTKSTNLWTFVIFLLLLFSGSLLYCYVWEESSAFNVGYFIGSFWRGYIWQMTLLAFAANILSGYLILYFCNGRQTKAIRCHSCWSGVGYYSTRPVSLKWYRLFLLLPGILMGILPFLHGFCTGNKTVYAFGIFSLACAVGDVMLYWKLRPFDDEDLYQAEGKPFEGTVIRRNYAKEG